MWLIEVDPSCKLLYDEYIIIMIYTYLKMSPILRLLQTSPMLDFYKSKLIYLVKFEIWMICLYAISTPA